MGLSKRAYLDKIRKQKYWEDKEQEQPKELINKTMHCHAFQPNEGQRGGTVIVEIKDSKCSMRQQCFAVCKFL